MQLLKNINLVLAFLLELGLFSSVSYWGFQKGNSTFTKWIIAFICFSIAVGLWAVFAAPKSESRLPFHLRLVFELVMFLVAAFALNKLNYILLSYFFAIISILSVSMAFIFKQ
jgi:Protein of unknown function (DUF2568)